VTFSVDTPQRLSGMVFAAKYGGADVDPVGVGEGVACKTLLANGLGAYNDEEADASLVGAIVHVQGVQGTTDLAKCRFEAPNGLTSMDLDIGVSDAVGPNGDPLSKTPTVFVGELACGTAAQLGGDDDGDGEPEQDCDGSYEVTFAVNGSARLGALQVGVDYSAASGLFSGTGEAVQCSADVDALAMFNDREGFKTLNVGLIATGGFQAPHDVFTCKFEGVGRAPTVADFAISVQDASTVEGADVSPEPSVHVSVITGGAGNQCGEPAPECGNGIAEADEECDDGNLDDQDGCLSNCSESTCGDIDGNGSVTATDAKRTLNVAVGLAADCSLVRCDVNSTGSVTATDARMILNESVGLDVALDCSWALIAGL
jgi:cysteine-rich repeat protein